MSRRIALVVVFAVSVAGGVWMLSPAPPPRAPRTDARPGTCDEGSACSTVVSSEEHGEPGAVTPQAPAAPANPAPANPSGATPPAPAPAADGARLREDADRLIAEGRIAEGLAAMRTATEADPSARNHGDLGALLERLTVFDEAAVHLARAAQLDPRNADRWIALANVNYLRVNPGEAWKAERQAREVEPGLVLGRGPDGLRVRKDDSAGAKK